MNSISNVFKDAGKFASASVAPITSGASVILPEVTATQERIESKAQEAVAEQERRVLEGLTEEDKKARKIESGKVAAAKKNTTATLKAGRMGTASAGTLLGAGSTTTSKTLLGE